MTKPNRTSESIKKLGSFSYVQLPSGDVIPGHFIAEKYQMMEQAIEIVVTGIAKDASDGMDIKVDAIEFENLRKALSYDPLSHD